MLTYDHTHIWRGIQTPGVIINTLVFKIDSFNRLDIHPFLNKIISSKPPMINLISNYYDKESSWNKPIEENATSGSSLLEVWELHNTDPSYDSSRSSYDAPVEEMHLPKRYVMITLPQAHNLQESRWFPTRDEYLSIRVNWDPPLPSVRDHIIYGGAMDDSDGSTTSCAERSTRPGRGAIGKKVIQNGCAHHNPSNGWIRYGVSLRKKRKLNGKRDIDLWWIIPTLRWSNAYRKTLEEKELEIERKGTKKEEATVVEEFPFLIRGLRSLMVVRNSTPDEWGKVKVNIAEEEILNTLEDPSKLHHSYMECKFLWGPNIEDLKGSKGKDNDLPPPPPKVVLLHSSYHFSWISISRFFDGHKEIISVSIHPPVEQSCARWAPAPPKTPTSKGVLAPFSTLNTLAQGYVLPWGQMSFWGATIITSLASAIPIVGDTIVTWLWGGFSVVNATLNQFFSLHYLLPFILVGASLLHLVALHQYGSNNPLGHPKNYIPANPMSTPPHIVPEWLGWGCLGLLGVGAGAIIPHFTTLDKLGSSVWMAWLALVSMWVVHLAYLNLEESVAYWLNKAPVSKVSDLAQDSPSSLTTDAQRITPPPTKPNSSPGILNNDANLIRRPSIMTP
eukprot:Gb_20951 [translate_table: standard]